MRAKMFKQSSTPKEPAGTNSYVEEALAIQAARRPKKTPPKILDVTKPLPRMSKPHRRRRTV